MITFTNLHKNYGKLEVLKGLNLTVSDGKITAVLGPNGSGKTTLIKSFLGMVIPSEGEISFQEKNIKGKWQYREEVSYLPQIANFPKNLTVLELLKMIKNLKGKHCETDSLKADFRLEPHLKKSLGNLSGGTKQKVNIVLAFMVDNPLLVLDEPTSGLDPVSLLTLKRLILSEKEKGKTILITSHILSFVEEIADEIVFILEGDIYFQGTVTELLVQTSKSNFEEAIASLLLKGHA